MRISSELRQHLAKLGRKGGKSRSPAKCAACRANLQKRRQPKDNEEVTMFHGAPAVH